MALTDLAVRNAKFAGKPFRIADSESMYLLVNAAGKYWRLDYRCLGKRKTLALGTYPRVSLAAVRQKRAEPKQRLDEGIDPVKHKRLAKRTRLLNAENTFQAVALEWFSKNKHTWVASHLEKILARLQKDIFPADRRADRARSACCTAPHRGPRCGRGRTPRAPEY